MNRLKTLRLAAFDGLELRSATLQNQAFPTHFHEHFSITVLEKGAERLDFGPLRRVVPTGSTVVIGPFEAHAHGPTDGSEWAYRTLYLPVDVVNFLAKKANRTLPDGPSDGPSDGPAQTDDAGLFEQIFQFHAQPTVATEAVLLGIVDRLAAGGFLRKRPADASLFSATADQIAAARAQIESAADGQNLCLDRLAAAARMSKFHFLRTFRAATGLAPGAFQLFCRVQRAKKMLLEGRSATEAALEAGFFDPSHFGRSFKKYVGISPAEFKKGCSAAAF